MKNARRAIQNFFVLKPRIPFRTFPRVYFPKETAEASAKLVASFSPSLEQHEGVVYLAGVPGDGVFVITTVIAPDATTTRGSY